MPPSKGVKKLGGMEAIHTAIAEVGHRSFANHDPECVSGIIC